MSQPVFNTQLSLSPGAFKFANKMKKIAINNANRRADNGKQASNKTISDAIEFSERMAKRLWGLGYMIQEPHNLNEKHTTALLNEAWQRFQNAGTFSVWITQTRKIANWLGKPGLVRHASYYVPESERHLLTRRTAATRSKSPQGNGIDVHALVAQADNINLRFGAMLRLMVWFGLRRKEVLKLRPHVDDRGTYLDIRAGVGKGTRTRVIPIETSVQREMLDYVKGLLADEHLGWPHGAALAPGRSLFDANTDRLQYFLNCVGLTKKQLGVTAHGLRAGYCEERAIELGLIPATRGGMPGQMSKEQEKLVKMKLSENMGHSRISVTGAYCGTVRSVARSKQQEN
jgi:integrase